MTQKIDLSGGSGVAVVVARGEAWLPAAFEHNPKVLAMGAEEVTGNPLIAESRLPKNTRVVLLPDPVAEETMAALKVVGEKRGIPYLTRYEPQALETSLREMIGGNGHEPEPTRAAAVPRPRGVGSLKHLVATEGVLTGGIADEARRLLSIAESRGLTTSFSSICQAIYRRFGGRTHSAPVHRSQYHSCPTPCSAHSRI